MMALEFFATKMSGLCGPKIQNAGKSQGSGTDRSTSRPLEVNSEYASLFGHLF